MKWTVYSIRTIWHFRMLFVDRSVPRVPCSRIIFWFALYCIFASWWLAMLTVPAVFLVLLQFFGLALILFVCRVYYIFFRVLFRCISFCYVSVPLASNWWYVIFFINFVGNHVLYLSYIPPK